MNNKYAELRKRQQEEFNAIPLGFAFSDEQFTEMMQRWGLDPNKDIDKIYSIGCSGYIQKKDSYLLQQTSERHSAELKAAVEADKTGDGFIYQMFLYELANHEYGYTGDSSDTLAALGYTSDEVQHDERLRHGFAKACETIWAEE